MAVSAESATDKQRRRRMVVHVRTSDAGVFGNLFIAPRRIPEITILPRFKR